MRNFEEIDKAAFELSTLDRDTWCAIDEGDRNYWRKAVVANDSAPRFVQVVITRNVRHPGLPTFHVTYQDENGVVKSEDVWILDRVAARSEDEMEVSSPEKALRFPL